MSRDRYDVLERFAPLFEPSEPSFQEFLRRRDRRRRNQRITAGVVGIAVFVAAVWILATGWPFHRTQTPAVPGPTVPPTPRVGFIGLPPEGATPSSPESGELVLGIGFGHTGGDAGRFSLHLYADGRLIWQRIGDLPGGSNRSSTGLIEQHLTPEGIGLVLAEVLSTGLFDDDRELVGAAPGLHYGGIEVRAGDRVIHLTWGGAGFEQGSDPIATTPTPDQARALERLDARLEHLASWLPASAWAEQEMRAYVPSRYSVCYSGRDEALERPRILDMLPAPAEDLLRALDTTRDEFNGSRGSIPYWCSVVTTEEARALAQILNDAGVRERYEDVFGLGYVFGQRDPGAMAVSLSFEPLLPNET